MQADHPWPFTQEINLYGLDQNYIDEDFIAIKVGDVNETAAASLSSNNAESRSLNTKDIIVSQDKNVIHFKAGKDFNDIYGFQFVLQGARNIQGVIPGAVQLGMQHVASSRDKIVCSFDSKDAVQANEGEILFSLQVFGIDKNVKLETEKIAPQVYIGNSFEIAHLDIVLDDLVNAYTLKNIPNPFTESTEISFSLPQAEEAQIRVFDVAGRMLFTQEKYYNKGSHTVTIDADQLGNIKGVYFYELKTKTFTELKRMMLVD